MYITIIVFIRTTQRII